MFYTTRNVQDALNFVNSLPFEEAERAELVSFFPVITQLMKEMKDSKSLNSKGGEKWFTDRISGRVKSAMTQISTLLSGLEYEELQRAQFVASQNAMAQAVLELAQECEASGETLSKLEEYCDFMNALVRKYSGFNRDL